LLVDDAELERRRAAWRPQPNAFSRGYAQLYTQHVLGAERGADFDFLVGGSGSAVAREMH
jgi:dihydroxy-acid dehydratase